MSTVIEGTNVSNAQYNPTGPVAITQAQPDQPQQPQVGRALCNLMYAVQYTIKRPTARPVVANAVVEIMDGQEKREVKSGEITAPRWIADIHPIWRSIDQTATKLKKVIDEYSVCDVFRGARLVPQDAWETLKGKIDEIKAERRALVETYKAKLEPEILPALKEKYPNDYDAIVKALPSASDAQFRFAIFVDKRPFVEPTGSDAETQQMFENMARDRFNKVLEDISTEIMKVCQRVETGIGGGRTQDNHIESILSVLERVERFKAFTGRDLMQHLYAAKGKLQEHSAKEINRDGEIRQGIQAAFAPLLRAAQELTEQAVGQGRVSRSINI